MNDVEKLRQRTRQFVESALKAANETSPSRIDVDLTVERIVKGLTHSLEPSRSSGIARRSTEGCVERD
jgi:hypothetical protein